MIPVQILLAGYRHRLEQNRRSIFYDLLMQIDEAKRRACTNQDLTVI